MNDVHSNIFPTPLQIASNYPYKKRMLDIDRAGYGYIVTIKFDLNKKGEVTKDVVLVEHLGYFTFDLHAKYVTQSTTLLLWERAVTSGDYVLHMQRLEKELSR